MSGERHATLDDDAAARLDELIALAREQGHATGPGRFMSNAIRVLHALATGEAALIVREESESLPMIEGADVPGVVVRH